MMLYWIGVDRLGFSVTVTDDGPAYELTFRSERAYRAFLSDLEPDDQLLFCPSISRPLPDAKPWVAKALEELNNINPEELYCDIQPTS